MRITVIMLIALLLLIPGCTGMPEEVSELGLTPKIDKFEANPSVINKGEVTYLHWSVSNADSVSIDNGIGNVALTGEIPVSPVSTTFYTLTAKNFAGEATAGTQIMVTGEQTTQPVTPTVTAPTIVTFYTDRIIITPGEHVTLSWDVVGATDVTITPIGQVNTKDSVIISPSNTTTYTMTATNSAGQSTAGITVTVQSSLPEQQTYEGMVVLKAIPAESGSLVRGSGYLDYTKYENVCAGDTAGNMASKAFLSFDISSIPDDAIIEEAVLDLSNYTKYGDPSYMRSSWGNMGALEVYHLQYGSLEGPRFSAYSEDAELTANGEFTSYPLSPWAWDVKDSNAGEPFIQNLIEQGKSRCQFRIQFFTTTNWDSTSDMFCFDDASLTIKYASPE
jgi:hypothetical protein